MEKKRFMKYLLGMESPFSWAIPVVDDIPVEKYIDVQIEKFENTEDESDFQWARFILGLQLSYELCDKKKDYDGALKYTTWCKNHLHSLNSKTCQEQLFTSLYPTLLAITYITETIILLQSGKGDKAHEVIEELPFPPSVYLSADRSTVNAGLLGTRAALYLLYGTVGHRLALVTAKEARDLDPDQAEWWFLIGNALGRIRRTENTLISEEEISAIKKAFDLEKNATFVVHLAQLYYEYSTRSFNRNNAYAMNAMSLYREAIKLRPNCLILKARVAHGVLRIRDKHAADIPFAKQLLDELVNSTVSNSMVYHDLGYYYERFGNNTEEALACLSKANDLGNIKALLYMISLKWKHGKRDEVIEDLKEGLTRYKSEEAQAQLLAYLGACYALIRNDWESAVESIQGSLCIDPSAKYVEKFIGFDGRNVNLLELVVNHHYYIGKLQSQDSSETIRSFLNLVHSIKPNIIRGYGAKNKFNDWKNKQLR